MTQIKKHYGRILEISDDHKQITLPDGRYYQRNGEYYPSVTYVLSHYPKGKFFEDWLKKVGYSADYIVKKASEEGTQVHEMIEDYLNGKELKFLEHGRPMYSPNIWQMFLRFVDFWEEYKPTLIEAEIHLFSDELKIAGTCDMVCEINGWEMYESSRSQEDNLNIYKAVRTLFDIENPNHKPAFTEFRTTAKRNL